MIPSFDNRIRRVCALVAATLILPSLPWMLLPTLLIVPQVLWGADWFATVGAQSNDKGRQALAFLPNEIWINVNDSITWTIDVDEPHTITFLTDGQIRPPFTAAPSAIPPVTFDGLTPVSSTGDLASIKKGNKFTVTFTKTGDFKLVCLFHENMTGVVHVLDAGVQPPHNQDFYDRQAADQRRDLLSDRDGRSVAGCGQCAAIDSLKASVVAAGTGEISATAGGTQTLSVMRFLKDSIQIRAGDTVEWTNLSPVEPHTVTFGNVSFGDGLSPFPADLVRVDPDGARHADISSNADNISSGLIFAGAQDPPAGMGNQTPLTVTRFRVTFHKPGTFPYVCLLHDELGMTGTVIVLQ